MVILPVCRRFLISKRSKGLSVAPWGRAWSYVPPNLIQPPLLHFNYFFLHINNRWYLVCACKCQALCLAVSMLCYSVLMTALRNGSVSQPLVYPQGDWGTARRRNLPKTKQLVWPGINTMRSDSRAQDTCDPTRSDSKKQLSLHCSRPRTRPSFPSHLPFFLPSFHSFCAKYTLRIRNRKWTRQSCYLRRVLGSGGQNDLFKAKCRKRAYYSAEN